jgi:hypothetical protein
MVGHTITYVLLFIVAIALILSHKVVARTEKAKYLSLTDNKLLFRIYMIAGYGLLLCIPNKSIAWVVLLFLFFLLIRVMQSIHDGVDEDGIYLAGRKVAYSRFQTYSMRRLEKTTEFRFYGKNRIRMMEFPNNKADLVERQVVVGGLKKQKFEEVTVIRK